MEFIIFVAMESQEREKTVNIVVSGHDSRSRELIEALTRGRPGTEFIVHDAASASCLESVDWFMMMEPDAVSVFQMKEWLRKGTPVITVDSEVSERFLNDDCALIFGPGPTDEEFVRGMLPFLESDFRMKALRAGALTCASAICTDTCHGGKPAVSVILSCYNQEDTVREAIESILGQECDFPVELIIGDDASTDGTRGICMEYAVRFPHVVRLMPETPNKGVVGNYFDCLEVAHGEYVADCAGDDRWVDPFRLQKQVDYMRGNPVKIAVMSDWIIKKGDALKISSEIYGCPQFSAGFNGRELIQFILGFGRYLPFLSAILYRRSPIMDVYNKERNNIRRDEWGCEDIPLLFHLGLCGNVGYVPLTASLYNITPGGISSGAGGDGYDFISRMTVCIADLREAYSIDISAEAAKGMNARLRYLASLILENPTDERISFFDSLCRRWPLPLSPKIRIYRAAFRSGLGMKALRSVKRLIHS